MTAKLRFLGGAREVGRSAMLIEDILVDFGVKTDNPPKFPITDDLEFNSIIATHGHLDHVGGIPILMNNKPLVHQTPPTQSLTKLLAEDTLRINESIRSPFSREDILRLSETSRLHGYNEVFEVAGHHARFLNSGHIPGSASVIFDINDDRFLHISDINTNKTRLLNGADEPPRADSMTIEATYFNEKHTPRKELEKRFIETVENTLIEGGIPVIPVFAIQRTQEILLTLKEHNVPCYLDGMGKKVTRIFREHPGFIKNASKLKKAWNHADKVEHKERHKALEGGKAVVTTSGMLSGGPVTYYLKRIKDNPLHTVCLTGYQVEGTPGRFMLDHGSKALIGDAIMNFAPTVEIFDFSAHSDGENLKEYTKKAVQKGVTDVFVLHGEKQKCIDFSEWINEETSAKGYAPQNGETHKI